MKISERIKALRTEKGIKQEDLAKAVGISRTLLSHIENGTKKLSADLTPKFAKAFDVSIDYLFTTKISSPNDFSNKQGIIREYTYINQERIRTLLSSTGKFATKNITTETEKSIHTKLGVSKIAEAGYDNNSTNKVTADLIKDIPNEASELISWFEENDKIKYDLDIEQYIPNQIYEISLDIELSPFEKAMDTLTELIDTFTTFSAFSDDENSKLEGIEMIKPMLELFKDSNASYILSDHNNTKFVGKVLKKHLLVEDIDNFESTSKVLCKISKIINKDQHFPIISNRINKLIKLAGNDKFFEIFDAFSKLGISISKEDVYIPGKVVVFEPIIIYK